MAERGLSAAGRADECKRFPGRNGQIDMRQHVPPLVICKAHVVKTNLASDVFERLCVRRVLDVRFDVHDLAEAGKARHAEQIHLRKVREPLDRRCKRGHIQRKRQQQHGFERARVDQIAAHRQHDEIEHADEELRTAVEPCHIAIKIVLRMNKARVALLKLVELVRLVRERLRHAHAGDAGLDIRIDLRDALLDLQRALAHPNAHPHHIGQHDGQHAEQCERQPPLNAEHDDERAENRQRGNDHVLRSVMRELRHVEQVVRCAGKQLARPHLIEKAELQLLDVRKNIPANIRLHAHAEQMAPVVDDEQHDRAQNIGRKDQHDQRHELCHERRRLRHGGQERTQNILREHGERKVNERDHRGAGHVQDEQRQMRFIIGKKSF
ncbi:unknown [Clostridium sp. CAG:1024]|nr:unknown [Clostridium sp. CAG:1024]